MEAKNFTATNNVRVGTAKNMQQAVETSLEYATEWLPLCKTYWETPGFVKI